MVKENDFLSFEDTSRLRTEVSVRFAVSEFAHEHTFPELITPRGAGPDNGACHAFAPTCVKFLFRTVSHVSICQQRIKSLHLPIPSD